MAENTPENLIPKRNLSKFGLNPNALSKIHNTWNNPNPDNSPSLFIIKAADELSDKVYKDDLSGLYNRNAWEDFQKRIDLNRGHQLTLVSIDLNGLKEKNDREGHFAGDIYIKKTANYLQEVFSRDSDRIFRVGGDEIIIACDFVKPESRDSFTSYLNQRLNHETLDYKGLDFSFGVAFSNENDISIKDTLKRADATMYQNKNNWKKQHPERYPSRQNSSSST